MSKRSCPRHVTRRLCGCRYALRLVALAGVMLIITEQYLQPTIANSLVPLRQLNWPHMIERILKLSLPTLYGWIIMFYCLFHLWLNILAELTFFGDREFYKVLRHASAMAVSAVHVFCMHTSS